MLLSDRQRMTPSRLWLVVNVVVVVSLIPVGTAETNRNPTPSSLLLFKKLQSSTCMTTYNNNGDDNKKNNKGGKSLVSNNIKKEIVIIIKCVCKERIVGRPGSCVGRRAHVLWYRVWNGHLLLLGSPAGRQSRTMERRPMWKDASSGCRLAITRTARLAAVDGSKQKPPKDQRPRPLHRR